MKILLKDSDLFFQNNSEKFRKDIFQAVVFSAIFSGLTAFTLEAGWTTVSLKTPFIATFFGIFGVILLGIAIFSLLMMVFAFRNVSKVSFKKSFFILAYAATPLLLIAWFPNGFVKLIGIVWTFNFIWVGLQVFAKIKQRESLIITIALAAILAIFSAISQIYLISPL